MTDQGMGDVSWARVMLGFTVVIGLLALFALALKYIKMRGFVLPGAMAQQRRMQVVETLPIDPRRRLVIVRRDDKEHLLLLGNQDIVIEANLDKSSSAIQTKSDS